MSENTYRTKSWDESVASGPEDGPRYAHARATFSYTGLIEGTGTCDYLLYYAGAGYDGGGERAPGYERVEGTVGGREGSFVIRHDVAYGADGIADVWSVVPGSGTGELAGLSGSGTAGGASETIEYTFEYELR